MKVGEREEREAAQRKSVISLIYSKVVAFEVLERLETRALENILALLESKQ